jgi:hypothetical protein
LATRLPSVRQRIEAVPGATAEVCKTVQLSFGSVVYAPFMMCCPYCHQPATMTIISNPAQVCVEHALEFWTGLLVYAAKDHSDPCVSQERLCTRRLCRRLSAPDRRAIAAAGPSPPDEAHVQIRLAS